MHKFLLTGIFLTLLTGLFYAPMEDITEETYQEIIRTTPTIEHIDIAEQDRALAHNDQ